jgi:hypothetical protein
MHRFWKILTFRGQAFQGIKNDEMGFGTALRFFIVVALVASLGQLLALQGIAQQQNISSQMAAAGADLEARAQGAYLPAIIADPMHALAQWLTEFSQVLEAGQPPLGKGVSQFVNVMGGWLASPFNALAVWLPGAVLLFVCAKLLRGAGSVRQHLSLVMLAFAPQVITLAGQLGLIPGLHALGGLFSALAWLWSLALLIFALMQAHGFTAGRSIGTLLLAFVFTGLAGTVVALIWGALTAVVIKLLS